MGTIPGLSLIDIFVVLGLAVVVPVAVGGPRVGGWWWWVAAAAGVVVSLQFPPGPVAAVLVAPWIAAGVATLAGVLRAAWPLRPWRPERRPGTGDALQPAEVAGSAARASRGYLAASLEVAVRALAAGYALMAGGAMVRSRLGLELLGSSEPIVELTAVHYVYAGTAALVLAGAAHAGASPRGARVGLAAVALTAVAPPVVAAGFVSRLAWLQVGGAVLLTVGVWLTAGLQLAAATRREEPPLARALLAVSGLAVWVPMVLAVAWAAGQHWDVPALSIPDMVRTHGMANGLGFVLAGLAGRHLALPARAHVPAG